LAAMELAMELVLDESFLTASGSVATSYGHLLRRFKEEAQSHRKQWKDCVLALSRKHFNGSILATATTFMNIAFLKRITRELQNGTSYFYYYCNELFEGNNQEYEGTFKMPLSFAQGDLAAFDQFIRDHRNQFPCIKCSEERFCFENTCQRTAALWRYADNQKRKVSADVRGYLKSFLVGQIFPCISHSV
jgi:hypothetical protein